MTQEKKFGINYQWLILIVAFYGCCIHSGCLMYAFSLMVKPLQTEFSWDRATIMLAFTLQFLCLGFVSPLVGKAVDTYGNRKIISLGAIVASLGFLSLTLTKSPLHFYIGNIIVGLGSAAMGPVPLSAAVSKAFVHKRGLAIGIMSTGIGVGGFVFSPLLGGFFIPNFGWQGGYVSIAVFTILMLPLAMLILKKQAPRRDATANATASTDKAKASILSLPVILISAGFFLYLFSLVGTLQTQVPHLQDIGFPVLTASSALGALGLMSAIAKFFFGWLCDKVAPKFAFVIGAAFLTVGIFMLTLLKPTSSPILLWAYAIVFGIGVGSWLPIMSMMVSSTFGMAAYGVIFGAVSLFQTAGSALGPLGAGFLFDLTGDYNTAFTVFIGVSIASILVIMSVKQSTNAAQNTDTICEPLKKAA